MRFSASVSDPSLLLPALSGKTKDSTNNFASKATAAMTLGSDFSVAAQRFNAKQLDLYSGEGSQSAITLNIQDNKPERNSMANLHGTTKNFLKQNSNRGMLFKSGMTTSYRS